MRKRGMAYLMTATMILGMFMGVPGTTMKVEAATTVGGFTVEGGASGVDYEYDSTNGKLIIKTGTALVIKNTAQNTNGTPKPTTDGIYINNNVSANLTFAGVSINTTSVDGKSGVEIPEGSTGIVTIKVSGYNFVTSNNAPAIKKNGTTGMLIIDDIDDDDSDDDELSVVSRSLLTDVSVGAAAIGGESGKVGGNITINGGLVMAFAASRGAAIGGGAKGNGSNITINGGNVKAIGFNHSSSYNNVEMGAAIGGGYGADGTNITINGGTVLAQFVQKGNTTYGKYITIGNSVRGGAAIGGGFHGSASNITIAGGTVTAVGGSGINGAAAIGAGSYGGATGIKITGGHITATGGGTVAAAIGSGEQEVITDSSQIKNVDVTITGGTIVATGGINAPGIGAGERANVYAYISGGSINAKSGGAVADRIGFGSEQKSSSSYRKNLVYSVAERDTTNDKETLKLNDTYKATANSDLDGKIGFRYSDGTEYTYNTNDMKTDASGSIYAYIPEDVEIYEKTADGVLRVLYNNSELQDCYSGPVDISANGYKVSNSMNGSYNTTYTISASGTYTLYFKGNISGEVTTKSVTVKIDNAPPTVLITLGKETYRTVNAIATVQSYISSNNMVTIYYNDTGSGVQSVQYGFASQCYNEDSIESYVSWRTVSTTTGNTSFSEDFNEAKAIYVKITDNMGNVSYASTPVIYNDTTVPVNTVSVSNATSDSATVSIRVNDESVTQYAYVVLPDNETAPTDWTSLVNKISSGNGGQGTCSYGSETVTRTISGLRPGTPYKVYVISKNALTDLLGATKENVSNIATASFSTTKLTANVSDVEYVIKAGISTTSYTYDLKTMLTAAGLNVTDMTNLQYACTANSGSVLSASGNLNVSNGVVTIPVHTNLAEDLRQELAVTFTSDNYEPIHTSLTVVTVGRTIATLSGVSVSDVVYDGNEHPYTGTIQWMVNGTPCVDASATDVTYEGVNGTNYTSSTTAPTNAGTYQVNFAIKDNNTDYKGMQSYTFEIKKANLTNAMSEVAWYMDGTSRIYDSDDAKVTEDGNTHHVVVNGYPEDKVIPQYSGTYSSNLPGKYTATVRFELTDEASVNYNVPQTVMTRDWEIVDRITPDMSNVKWVHKQGSTQNTYTEGSTKLYVNGIEYAVEVTGLPEGVRASYSGTNKATAVGDYTANVSFEVTDSTKYKNPDPSSMSLSWSIHKNSAYVSGQTYLIKSSASTNSYAYDVNDLLKASGLNASMFDNLQYACAKSSGNILSNDPSVDSQGIMTIPVNTYLNSGLAQDIIITFTSDNYETITTILTVETMEKTPVTLTGVSVSDTVYDGNEHPYVGTVQWVADGVLCVDMNDTEVVYIGVDGTNYPSSGVAPTNAGTYQVTFAVKGNNTDYIGTQSYTYTIAKANLTNEMADVAWYLDGSKISTVEEAKVTENGRMHQVSVQGYPSDKVTPQYGGTYGASTAGYYTAEVSFNLTEEAAQNYNVPESMTLSWQIVDRITPDMSSVKWVYKQGSTQNLYTEGFTNLYVNGDTYTMEVTGLPEGVIANYSGNVASVAGDYTAYVTFSVTDSTKYKNPEPSSMRLSWSIKKNTAYVSSQTYWVNAGEGATSYTYDANTLLTASGLNASMFDSLHYACSKGDGNILSDAPILYNNILTIPVNGNLAENDSQNISIIFMSDNYEDIHATLTVKTMSKSVTQVNLSGVTVENKVYNGQPQGYSGSIVWKDINGTACVYDTETEVIYEGVNGTTYNSSNAPTNAGTYKVTFDVRDISRYIGSATYQYTIYPADLSNEMVNIKWCIDDNQVDANNAKVLFDNNVHTVSITNYPDAYITPIYVNHQKIAIGEYKTVVRFEVNELYEGNYSVPASIELDWEIVEELEEVVEKITPDMSNVRWIYKQDETQGEYHVNSTKLIANGKTYTVAVIGVPEGVTVQYSGITNASAAGTYLAMAIFGVTDTEKYHQPNLSSVALEWRIEDQKVESTPLPSIGEPILSGNGKYKVTSASENGGTVEYTGSTGMKASLKEVTIPATIVIDGKTYSVTTIAKNAFSGYKKLTKVKISNGITIIGANAFKGCEKLTKITIPNSVTSIGSNAFSGCKRLKTVSIQNSSKLAKIGDKAFYKCVVLTKITIPKNVTTIGKQSFFGCKKLKTITIKSKKLKKVGSKAIKGIYKKATIKCPGKKYVTKYKKLFKSKTGYAKTMKIK